VDIAPTLIEVAGGEPLENIRGKSLLRLLAGEEAHAETLFSEIQQQSRKPDAPTFRALRNNRFRLTVETNTGTACELFDLREDPLELTNRVQDPSMTGIISELRAQLEEHLA